MDCPVGLLYSYPLEYLFSQLFLHCTCKIKVVFKYLPLVVLLPWCGCFPTKKCYTLLLPPHSVTVVHAMQEEPCANHVVPCITFFITTMCQKSMMLHVSDDCWKSDGQAIVMSHSVLLRITIVFSLSCQRSLRMTMPQWTCPLVHQAC